MTISVLPAIVAILLGLLASGAIDFTTSAGNTHAEAWIAFGITLAIVVRDTLLGGSFRPSPREDNGERFRGLLPGLEIQGADLRLRIWQFEPVATTLAILLGLLTFQSIDFVNADGGATDWAWTVFGLSLFLALGGRLNRRPGRRTRHRRHAQEAANEFEARVHEIFDDIQGGFRPQPPSASRDRDSDDR